MIIESDECVYELYTREKNHTELFRCFNDRPRRHVGATLLTKKHFKYRDTHDCLPRRIKRNKKEIVWN
ncbi:hypothetical protein ANTRET_LOCUS1839 [Anthophora retusa]